MASRNNQDSNKNERPSEIIKEIDWIKELFPDITNQQCKRMETDLAFREGLVLGISLFEKRASAILKK